MNNEVLISAAGRLKEAAKSVSHPLLPAKVRDSIVLAAYIVEELVKREVQRNVKE